MSDETNVTFVGGKAVEQTEGLESNLETDEREAAKEAVRKAIKEAGEESAKKAKESKDNDPFKPPGAKRDKEDSGKASEKKEDKDATSKRGDKDSGPERGPDGKFLPKNPDAVSKDSKADVAKSKSDGDSEESEVDPDKASVKELLKARERAAQIKRKASDEVSRERQEFERQRQEFQRQQWEFQQQQAQVQRQLQAFQALKSDPARAVKEVGLDPEEFILNLAQEGTPEGKANRQIRELQAQIQQMNAYQQQQLQAQQEYQRQLQQQRQVQHRHQAVQEFVTLGMDEEKYPHISTFYKGNERALVAFGDLTAEEYRNLSGGKEGSYADILDYIEDQLAERAKHWYSKINGSKEKRTPVVDEEERPKSKGKSLSPDASAERRTLKAKTLKDLDGDERLEAAKQAVAVALANSGKD